MKYTPEEYRNMMNAIRENFKLPWREREEQKEALRIEQYKSLEVGDHVAVHLWSDVDPATVIKRTKAMIVVRYDKAERDPSWVPEWIPGGFAAHCTNNEEQRWIITEDPDGRTERFYWSDRVGLFQKGDVRVTPGWYKRYDYNF